MQWEEGPVCPACMANMALMVTGAISTGGLTAHVVKTLPHEGRREEDRTDSSPTASIICFGIRRCFSFYPKREGLSGTRDHTNPREFRRKNMTGEAPSLTAQRVAMRRAAHQLFDDPPVFEEALAIAILGEEA